MKYYHWMILSNVWAATINDENAVLHGIFGIAFFALGLFAQYVESEKG